LPPGRLRRHASWVPAVPDDEDSLDLALASPEACPEVPAALAAAVESLPAYLHGHGYDSYGLPVLREAVARRYTARGLRTVPEQRGGPGGAGRGRRRDRDPPGHRRDVRRALPRRRARARAPRSARRLGSGRPGDHDRLHEQGLLGRAAGRLGPRRSGPGRAVA